MVIFLVLCIQHHRSKEGKPALFSKKKNKKVKTKVSIQGDNTIQLLTEQEGRMGEYMARANDI